MSDFNKNYFELFGLPQAFTLDLNLLRERYRQVFARVHPDKFAQASSQERRLALQYSSLINEAFKTLNSPVKRALYLLKLYDAEVDLERNTAMSPEFLMQQMQLREELDSVKDNKEGLAAFTQRLQDEKQELIKELEGLFADNPQDHLEKLQNLTLQLTFYEKLLKTL